jgi:hypothetical protein
MKGRPTLLTSRILQGVLGALCRFLHMKGHLIHVYSTLRQAEGKSKASPDAAVSLNIILQSLCGTSEERAGVEFRDWIRQETKEDFGTPSHVMLPLEKDGP